MEHGIVTDWADMEKIWAHIYGKGQLATFKEEHPVNHTETSTYFPFNNFEAICEHTCEEILHYF